MPGEPQGSLGAEVVTRELTAEEVAAVNARRAARGAPPMAGPQDITPEHRARLEAERTKAKAYRRKQIAARYRADGYDEVDAQQAAAIILGDPAGCTDATTEEIAQLGGSSGA